MKVAIDISNLHPGHRQRGVGVYTQQLFQSLQKIKKRDFSVALVEKGELPSDIDLVHYPWFDLFWPTLTVNKKIPSVITIHDVIPLRFPAHFPVGFKGKLNLFRQKMALKKINHILTDSQASKKDIIKFLKVPKNKISVIYLAADKQFRPIKKTSILSSIEVKYKLPKQFILYVGDVNYNKNVEGLIKAFTKLKTKNKKLKTQIKNLKIVLIGKAFLDKNLTESQKINKLIEKLNFKSQIVKLGFISKEDLVAIYNLATVYCQPSFWEGFGLPVLEAMACGTPVVVSQTSSLPEVVGEVGILVDPQSTESIARGIQEVLRYHSPDYNTISQNCFKRAKQFSWQKTCQETINVYQKVLKNE